jgi:Flp pilus assembly protein TadD
MPNVLRGALAPIWQVLLDYLDAASRPASDAAARALLDRAAAALRALDDDALIQAVTLGRDTGMLDDAMRLASAVARLAPERPGPHFAVGLALQFADRHAEAVEPYRRAMSITPSFPNLRNNLAAALISVNRCSRVVARLLEDAVVENPDDSRAWINLARLYPTDTDLARATDAAAHALALAPCDPLALNNFALLQKEAQNWAEAERAARDACRYAQNDPVSRFNLAVILLVRGNFAEGWPAHELRWQGSRELLKIGRPAFARPQWHGEPIAGRTLLLWGEQGLGDLLQFCRYVPMLAERVHREGGRLVWNSFPQMGALLERSLGGYCDGYSAGGAVEHMPPHDCEVSLLSLPMLFGTREETIPRPGRYLASEPAAAARWRERLSGESRLKVGLAWTGTRTHQRNPYRRVDPQRCAAHFAPLAGDVAFYALQPGAADDVATMRAAGLDIADFSGEWQTFDDTAAFVDALDLVISVCTSTAHLAGALGQRTWVMVDVNPHWVWQLGRRDSPWYPHTTLYRQKQFRQWEPVLEEIAADLAALARSRRA